MSSVEQERKLSNEQVDALCYMEAQFWNNNMELPSVASTSSKVGVPEKIVREWLEDSLFQAAMETWGLKFQEEGKLTAQQVLAVNMVLNLNDNRSMRQKLKDISLSVNKYNNWLRDPTFQRYVRQRTEQLFSNADNDAYVSLMKQINAGDMRAIQLYFEMTGIYNPKVQVEVNVEVVLSRVVDILVKHVKDPIVLDAIGDEIKELSARSQPGPLNLSPVGRAS